MTLQEIFDKSVGGVIGQGGPSVDSDGNCRYRGDGGRKCAAGWLIPDDVYDESMEYTDFFTFSPSDQLKFFGIEGDKAVKLLEGLQHAHDCAADGGLIHGIDFPTEFRARARVIAEHFNLNDAVAADPGATP